MNPAPLMFLLAALLAPTAAFAQDGGESSPAPVEEAAAVTEEVEPAAEDAQPAKDEPSEQAAQAPEDSADRAAIEALDEPSDDDLAPLPDLEAEELSEEEAAALEALQAEAVEPEQPPASDEVDDSAATGWSYYDGRAAGEADARIAPNYMQHGIAGLLGGLICSGCGCVGVTAAELLISPGVPQGPWQANDSSYQRGYIDGYRKTMQRRRALYAVAGGTLGTAVAFGTGFAVGVYRGTPPFVNF